MLRPSRLRLALQLGAGSVAVHELRYRLGGEHEARALTDGGHAYLTVLHPLLGILLTLAVAHFAWALWTRRPEAAGGGRMPLKTLAPALLVLHLGQETLEGFIAFGRPLDAAALLAAGEWMVLPLCLVVAATVSFLTRGARRLAHAVLAGGAGRTRERGTAPNRFAPDVVGRTSVPLARHGAERAPPLLTV